MLQKPNLQFIHIKKTYMLFYVYKFLSVLQTEFIELSSKNCTS
jgi:hypothetical protein